MVGSCISIDSPSLRAHGPERLHFSARRNWSTLRGVRRGVDVSLPCKAEYPALLTTISKAQKPDYTGDRSLGTAANEGRYPLELRFFSHWWVQGRIASEFSEYGGNIAFSTASEGDAL